MTASEAIRKPGLPQILDRGNQGHVEPPIGQPVGQAAGEIDDDFRLRQELRQREHQRPGVQVADGPHGFRKIDAQSRFWRRRRKFRNETQTERNRMTDRADCFHLSRMPDLGFKPEIEGVHDQPPKAGAERERGGVDLGPAAEADEQHALVVGDRHDGLVGRALGVSMPVSGSVLLANSPWALVESRRGVIFKLESEIRSILPCSVSWGKASNFRSTSCPA